MVRDVYWSVAALEAEIVDGLQLALAHHKKTVVFASSETRSGVAAASAEHGTCVSTRTRAEVERSSARFRSARLVMVKRRLNRIVWFRRVYPEGSMRNLHVNGLGSEARYGLSTWEFCCRTGTTQLQRRFSRHCARTRRNGGAQLTRCTGSNLVLPLGMVSHHYLQCRCPGHMGAASSQGVRRLHHASVLRDRTGCILGKSDLVVFPWGSGHRNSTAR